MLLLLLVTRTAIGGTQNPYPVLTIPSRHEGSFVALEPLRLLRDSSRPKPRQSRSLSGPGLYQVVYKEMDDLAVDREEEEVLYQPLLDLRSPPDTVSARWAHQSREEICAQLEEMVSRSRQGISVNFRGNYPVLDEPYFNTREHPSV